MSKLANFGTNQVNQILDKLDVLVSYLPKDHIVKLIILTVSGNMYCLTDFDWHFKPIRLEFEGNNPTVKIDDNGGFIFFGNCYEINSADEIVHIYQELSNAEEAIIAYHGFF